MLDSLGEVWGQLLSEEISFLIIREPLFDQVLAIFLEISGGITQGAINEMHCPDKEERMCFLILHDGQKEGSGLYRGS